MLREKPVPVPFRQRKPTSVSSSTTFSSSSSPPSSSCYYSYPTNLLQPLLLLRLLSLRPPPPSSLLLCIIIWSHKSERRSVFLHPYKESLGRGSDHCTAPPYKLQHKHRINGDTPSSLERDSDPEPWFLSG